MREENGQKNKKFKDFFRSKIFFLAIWIFSFLIVSIVFLAKIDTIKTNLKNTRFFERLFGSTPAFIQNHIDKAEFDKTDLGEGDTVINIDKASSEFGNFSGNGVEISSADSIWSKSNDILYDEYENEELNENHFELGDNLDVSEDELKETEDVENTVSKAEESTEDSEIEDDHFTPKSLPVEASKDDKKHEEIPIITNIETIKSKLWFVIVDADGRITQKQYIRNIIKSNAPLTNNIKLLLEGPNANESNSGCISLIPNGTRLLTAIVKNGIAYLNFSSEFEKNKVGGAGYLAQVQQIVFTSTEFATVNSVQFLIEGKKKETLGDVVWIGSPLSRADFK